MPLEKTVVISVNSLIDLSEYLLDLHVRIREMHSIVAVRIHDEAILRVDKPCKRCAISIVIETRLEHGY